MKTLPKVDRSVPVPEKGFGPPSPWPKFLKEMKAGESFVWPRHSWIMRIGRRDGIKLISRMISKDPVQYRIWKIE